MYMEIEDFIKNYNVSPHIVCKIQEKFKNCHFMILKNQNWQVICSNYKTIIIYYDKKYYFNPSGLTANIPYSENEFLRILELLIFV